MRMIIALFFVISFNAISMEANSTLDHYFSAKVKVFIPVSINNSEQYSHAVLNNRTVASIVNSSYLRSSNQLFSDEFNAEYLNFLQTNLKDGYLTFDFKVLTKQLNLSEKFFTNKNKSKIAGSFIKKHQHFSQAKLNKILDCFSFDGKIGWLEKPCFKNFSNAANKYLLYKNGYLMKEGPGLPVLFLEKKNNNGHKKLDSHF